MLSHSAASTSGPRTDPCGPRAQSDETLTPEDYYLDFAVGMQEIGYDGFIGYELCHPLPLVEGEPAGIEFADLNAQLAAEYMRGILKQAERTVAVAAKAV